MATFRLQCNCGLPKGASFQRSISCTRKVLKSFFKRCLVSEAVQQNSEKTPDCKTAVTQKPLAALGAEDLGLFHLISDNDVRTKLPHGTPVKLTKLWEAIGENGIMVRNPLLELLGALKADEKEGIPRKYLLYGPDGSGKTAILCQAVLYAAYNKWFTVHVPRGFNMTENSAQCQPGSWNSKRLDQPEVAAKWLKNFRTVNAHLLNDVKTHQQYLWGKREVTEKGSPLLAVVTQGLSRSSYSTDAVGVVLKELRIQAEHKVMVAVDNVNILFENTAVKNEGREWVPIDSLSLACHFKKLLNPTHGIHSGAYVMACSKKASRREPPRHWDYKSVLAEKSLDFLGPLTPVLVPNYSREEVRHVLEFYQEKGWITTEITDRLMNEIMFLTAGNCADLYHLSIFL